MDIKTIQYSIESALDNHTKENISVLMVITDDDGCDTIPEELAYLKKRILPLSGEHIDVLVQRRRDLEREIEDLLNKVDALNSYLGSMEKSAKDIVSTIQEK